MPTDTLTYHRSPEWFRLGEVTTREIAREAATRTAAVEHPDVPARSVGKYRRMVADTLAARERWHFYAAISDDHAERWNGAANLTILDRQSAAMATFATESKALGKYLTGTLGWSLDRAREIVASLVAEHADRCREGAAAYRNA